MSKKSKEESLKEPSRSERIAQKMAERIKESRILEAEYESTLDSRQFNTSFNSQD